MTSKPSDGAIFVVVGGGIAAVSCIEELASCSHESILHVSSSNVVKAISNWRQVGRAAEYFDVQEISASNVFAKFKNVRLLSAFVTELDSKNKFLITQDGKRISYRYLCIATGGKPKVVSESQFVIGIRDTESVSQFQHRLKDAKRIVVVGNGGIATELVYEVKNVEVIWSIKHENITASFVDAGAAEFFVPNLHKTSTQSQPINKRLKYTTDQSAAASGRGSALGPDWAYKTKISGACEERKVKVVPRSELTEVLSKEKMYERHLKETCLPEGFLTKNDWPVYVLLTNDEIYGCDLIVSATGVEPYTDAWTKGNDFKLAKDGGLLVNNKFETSIVDIFAAGDVCSAGWQWAPHWIQMRLWTQARQMGAYSGRAMVAKLLKETISLDICFEIFTHVTEFFGFKVILLGRFNGQGLRSDHEALVRVSKGVEYIKVLIQDGRVQGAVLIGETDLEETIENLILNATDIEHIKDVLLDPTVDIEDYFD